MSLKFKALLSGMVGGFIGNGILGALFSVGPLKALLYDPNIQSKLFLEITPLRNIPASVAGLVILSAFHGLLFLIFKPSIPGTNWQKKGMFWGLTIWLLFWVPQEWFIYHTLLMEPLLLNLAELMVLAIGCFAEGLIIARLMNDKLNAEKLKGGR